MNRNLHAYYKCGLIIGFPRNSLIYGEKNDDVRAPQKGSFPFVTITIETKTERFEWGRKIKIVS